MQWLRGITIICKILQNRGNNREGDGFNSKSDNNAVAKMLLYDQHYNLSSSSLTKTTTASTVRCTLMQVSQSVWQEGKYITIFSKQ